MKNKLALSAVVLAVTATNAFAADLPRRALPTAPTLLSPSANWTGFYAGVNAGGVWGGEKVGNTSITGDDGDQASLIKTLGASRTRLKSQGFTGGGQLGYNFQFAPGPSFVIGAETDFGYVGLHSHHRVSQTISDTIGNFAVSDALAYDARSSSNFAGTVRGRLGYTFNNVLVYGTGGFAYGNVGYKGSFSDRETMTDTTGAVATQSGLSVYNAKTSKVQTGYAYGGGVEYALAPEHVLNLFHTNTVSLRVEYMHYDLGSRSLVATATTPNASTVKYKLNDSADLVRAGLNYKFTGL